MLTRYELFLENQALDRINEAILYYSDKLKMVLQATKTKIGKHLLSIETDIIKPDITLVDLDKEGYFSFTTERNVKKKLADIYDTEIVDAAYDSQKNMQRLWKEHGDSFVLGKQSVRIGKLVNRLFPNEFSDKEIEEFVNKVKALLERAGEKISVVSGEDIAYWYAAENYFSQDGQLGNSCMKKSDYFDIYVMNPEVCKMVILTEFEKLKGRALLWKVDNEEFEWFMDRQYTNFDHDVVKFREYANSNGWAFRTYNDCHSFTRVTFNGNQRNINMNVKVKAKYYDSYPYMDTFKMYYPETGELHNHDDEKGYLLVSTGGDFTDMSGNWSDYYEERIPDEDGIYSEVLDDYIWADRAVEVKVGSRRGWYPDDYSKLCHDEINNRWLHTDDAIYSDYHKTYLLNDDGVEEVVWRFDISYQGTPSFESTYVLVESAGVIDVDDVSDTCWYKLLRRKWHNLEYYNYFLSQSLTKDSDDNWIPIKYKLDIYKVKNEDGYLTAHDAELLGKEIDDSDKKITDLVSYNTELYKKDILQEIINLVGDAESRRRLVLYEEGDSEG